MKETYGLTRRQFLVTAAATAAVGPVWSSTPSTEAFGSAAEALVPLRLREVMPEDWLRAQLQRDVATGFPGHLDDLLQDPESKAFFLKTRR